MYVCRESVRFSERERERERVRERMKERETGKNKKMIRRKNKCPVLTFANILKLHLRGILVDKRLLPQQFCR